MFASLEGEGSFLVASVPMQAVMSFLGVNRLKQSAYCMCQLFELSETLCMYAQIVG